MDADVEPPPPPATAPAGGRRGAGRAPATARARTQPGSYRAAEEEDCRVAAGAAITGHRRARWPLQVPYMTCHAVPR